MRILRILLLILFIITAAIFGVDQFRSYMDRDTQAPVFQSNNDEITLSVTATEDDFLQGITATDDRDGDVTSTIAIAAKSNFIEEGVIRVDYAAFDSHNNIGSYSRRVTFNDYHSPRIYSSAPMVMRSGTSFDYTVFRAEDVLDGDISEKIKVLIPSTSTSTTTEYPVEIEVTNNYGDVEKLSLNLDILDSADYNRIRPNLSEYIVYVPVGGSADLSSYLIGMRQGNTVRTFEEAEVDPASITVDDSMVDYTTPGMYPVFYIYNISWNQSNETEMLLIVTEDF